MFYKWLWKQNTSCVATLSAGEPWAFLPLSSTNPSRCGITRHFFLLSMNYFLSAGISLKCSNPCSIKLTSFCKWQLATEQFRCAEIVPVKQNNQTFICIPFTLRKLQYRFNVKRVRSGLLSCGTLRRMLSQQQIEAWNSLSAAELLPVVQNKFIWRAKKKISLVCTSCQRFCYT